MVDELEDDSVQRDNDYDLSHPDIDSTLELDLGTDHFSYKTRRTNGGIEHLVMRLKKGNWKTHMRIKNEEVKSFDSEEMATFLIHQIKMDRSIKRRLFVLFLVFIVVIISVALYSILILGIGTIDDFEVFLISGGVTVAFIPVFCILMSSAERSVDESVYALRPNFIQVLQKMMDLKEEPFQKRGFKQRIERLQRISY